jgi:hypothetical protein
MGINTTGKPNTSDYSLGRGAVYFAAIDATTGLPLSYRQLGNAPEFSITVETETLEHQSSLEGLKTVDKEVIISQAITATLSLDEINFENLSLLLSGEASTETNITAVASQFYDNVELGRWYDIYDNNGERAYDITANGDVAVTTGASSAGQGSALQVGTDYELDLVMGRVFVLTGGNISAGDVINIALTANGTTAPLGSLDTVEAFTQSSVTGALKFVAENPANANKKTEYQFHKISLKAEGDFSLIGDDWSVMQLNGKAEKNSGTASQVSGKTLTVTTHADA